MSTLMTSINYYIARVLESLAILPRRIPSASITQQYTTKRLTTMCCASSNSYALSNLRSSPILAILIHSLLPRHASLRGRRSKGKGKAIRARDPPRAPLVSLAPKTPFPIPFKRLLHRRIVTLKLGPILRLTSLTSQQARFRPQR